MIFDSILNYKLYYKSQIWQEAFNFLHNLNLDIPNGYVPIKGEDIFARVFTYNTIKPEEAKIETHNEYIDIQITLTGAEGFCFTSRSNLIESCPYNEKNDVTFYRTPTYNLNRVNVYAGQFIVFFPDDAHMPQLIVDKPQQIKKLVIKIKASLLKL